MEDRRTSELTESSVKVHYQSFGPPSNEAYLGSLRLLLRAAGSAHSADVQLGGLERARLEQKQHRAFHLRAGADMLDAVVQAVRQGADAAVIGNIQDPALYECRQVCEIPVIGMLETSLAATLPVARSVALVTTSDATIPLLEERARLYRLDGRVHSIRPMRSGLRSVSDSFNDRALRRSAIDEFLTVARGAVNAGAEGVIPASGILATLIASDAGFAAGWDLETGAPVANPVWLSVAAAALAARTHAHGLVTSRRLLYRQPPRAELDDYLAERLGADA
ncbi:aspartate/glutamate racemase family protein [Microbacterium sp.]|uniref:aspartate/glutamate racemase family protein n=1 Tax=Microbacterium sp. TaxID=51671 RepID=UPI0031FEE6DB|nr:aspartate/glutamate racemase family protein [Microbacterium sp.]